VKGDAMMKYVLYSAQKEAYIQTVPELGWTKDSQFAVK
jgi:hypothetical protein